MSTYMVIPKYKGSVDTDDFRGGIAIASAQFSFDREITHNRGINQHRYYALPQIGDFLISKFVDQSTAVLAQNGLSGTLFDTVSIHYCGEDNRAYLSYLLTEVMIASYSIRSEVDGVPMEEIALDFNCIECKVRMKDKQGARQSSVVVHDLRTLCSEQVG